MPYVKYKDINFSAQSQVIIGLAERIIQEYSEQGYDLTLRQLYYQYVARDIIANKQSEYKRLGSIINDARLAGMIDWDSIQDRTRNLRTLSHWNSPHEIIEQVSKAYHVDRWKSQEYRIEVWIEKDALVGVIENVCREFDVPFFSCRGYTSQSEMWAAAQRLIEYESENGQKTIILHLGDHDPSGIDMTRDIADRLFLFESEVTVERIALTMSQIRQYNPPPNPAKITDSRAASYISIYGNDSWELDALEPSVIVKLITDHILECIDPKDWKTSGLLEKKHRKTLEGIAKKLDGNKK